MFRTLPQFGSDPRNVSEVVRQIMNGKTNNTGTVTLATGNATTTTLFDERISPDTKIVLIPFSNAAFSDAAPYGCFTNNTDQLSPSVGATAVVALDSTEESNGVFLSNTSRVNVRNYGIYNVQFSLQLVNIDNDVQFADVWFRVNGTNVPRSASRFDLPARKSATVPSHVIGTVNTYIEMQAGDYVEIAGTTSSANISLESYPADVSIPRPAIPAAIVTVQYIAPQAYSNIYVSSQIQGQATITHFSNDTANKTYGYILVG